MCKGERLALISFTATQNRVMVDWLKIEKIKNVLRCFPIVRSLDGLPTLFGTNFELVIEICASNENRHHHMYKEHSQNMKNMDSTK